MRCSWAVCLGPPLDVLDLPLIYYMEGSWAIEGESQKNTSERDKSYADYSAAGVVPNIGFERASRNSPMLRYPWAKTRNCLMEMSTDYRKGLLSVSYVNPETGGSLFPSIGFSAIMLRPGEEVTLPKRTTPMVFHVVEGTGSLQVEQSEFMAWDDRDTLTAPGHSAVTLQNKSNTEPSFLICADEDPLHKYLGIY